MHRLRIVCLGLPLLMVPFLLSSEAWAAGGSAYGFTSITIGAGSANSFEDMFPGQDGYPGTADDHPLPTSGNATGSYSSMWLDVDGDGVYTPETTDPNAPEFSNPTFDPSGLWLAPPNVSGCGAQAGAGPPVGDCAPVNDPARLGDQPWIWTPNAARNNAAFAALSRPTLGMVALARVNISYTHAFNNGHATHANPLAEEDFEAQESSPYWGPWGNGAGGSTTIDYHPYNNSVDNQHGMGKSKYWFGELMQPEDDANDPYDMYGPPKENQNSRKTLTMEEPCGSIQMINFRQRVDDPRTTGFDEAPGRGFGQNGPCNGCMNCARELYTAGDSIETQGLLLPIDDIAGLQSGDLDQLNGRLAGDMADYVRTVLGPAVADVMAQGTGTNLIGNTGSCSAFDSTGVPTHLVIMERTMPLILDAHQKGSRFTDQEKACAALSSYYGVVPNQEDGVGGPIGSWDCKDPVADQRVGLNCLGRTFQTAFTPEVSDPGGVNLNNEFGCRYCRGRTTDGVANFTYIGLMVSKNGVDRPTLPPSELRNWEQSPSDGVARTLYGHEQWTRRARSNSMFQRMGVNYRHADGQRSRLILHDQHGGAYDNLLVDNLDADGLVDLGQDDTNVPNGNSTGPGWNTGFLYSDEGSPESPFRIENEAPLDPAWVTRYGCPGDSQPNRDGVLVLNGNVSGHFTYPIDPGALNTDDGAVSMILEIGAYPCENQGALYQAGGAQFIAAGDPGNVGIHVDTAAGDTGPFCYTDTRNPVPLGGDGIDDTTIQIVYLAPPASAAPAHPGVPGGHGLGDAVVAYAEVSVNGSEIFAGGTLNADGSASGGASLATGSGVTAWGDAGFGDGEYTRLVFRVSRISTTITEALGGDYTPFMYDGLDNYDALAAGPGISGNVGRVGYYSSGSEGTDKVGLDSWMVLQNVEEDAGDFLQPGDINGDGSANIADPITTLNFLFGGAQLDSCLVDGVTPTDNLLAIADWNDDSGINIADAIGELNYLFAGGSAHPNGVACANIGDGTCGDTCTP